MTVDSVIVSRHPAAVEFIRRHLSNKRVEYRLISYPEAQREAKANSPASSQARHRDVLQPWPVPDSGCTREETDRMRGIAVFESVMPEDVRGKTVYGNLPLHLACLAKELYVVEFSGTPPRGQEYTVDDMISAGAALRRYTVVQGEAVGVDPHELRRLGGVLHRFAEGRSDAHLMDMARQWADQITADLPL